MHRRSGSSGFIFMGALAALALPRAAHAIDISLKLEPGLAIPLSAPQSQLYEVGGGQAVKALFGLTPFLDVGPVISFLYLPAEARQAEAGTAWAFGAGGRLKRPHDAVSYHGLSPWFDADLLYVRTGALDRAGFDAALGLAVPIGVTRTFWVGPFVRYFQVFQGDRVAFDNRDAKTLLLGVSFEVGSGIARASDKGATSQEVAACPDRDGDGIPDTIDRCPDISGPMENRGCPVYKKLVVTKDKLELKEKLYFAWDEGRLEESSFPVLNEVVQALNDNPRFRVQIDGHTDSTGPDDHNQTLSEKRAEAVLDYLALHGIARERLVAKGFSSSEPRDTNATVAGRENNRRVEFVVHFAILNEGKEKQ